MSKPLPSELAVIEAFVNTVDLEDGGEALSIPAELADWLAEHALAEPGETFSHEDLASAIAVREALRALLLANNGGDLDRGAPATLTAAADRARLTVAVDEHGHARVEPRAAGIDRVFGRLLGIVARAQSEGTWDRLKACPWHTCHVAFYDHSRNRSRTWCSMAVCGNRAKAQTYRRRDHR
ncbi:MAG: CGNR zinc finger domain-containing protein [Solirubrobacteraceae bacterium]